MDTETIVIARKQAEETVADMAEGPLKTKAFEVILHKLLEKETLGASRANIRELESASADPITGGQDQKVPDSCPDRIVCLREEGFFNTRKTLSEIRNELQMHGWIYPVTSLSGPLQRLVQRRELRRMASQDSKKGSYTYVAP
jgi:hypothetical protein